MIEASASRAARSPPVARRIEVKAWAPDAVVILPLRVAVRPRSTQLEERGPFERTSDETVSTAARIVRARRDQPAVRLRLRTPRPRKPAEHRPGQGSGTASPAALKKGALTTSRLRNPLPRVSLKTSPPRPGHDQASPARFEQAAPFEPEGFEIAADAGEVMSLKTSPRAGAKRPVKTQRQPAVDRREPRDRERPVLAGRAACGDHVEDGDRRGLGGAVSASRRYGGVGGAGVANDGIIASVANNGAIAGVAGGSGNGAVPSRVWLVGADLDARPGANCWRRSERRAGRFRREGLCQQAGGRGVAVPVGIDPGGAQNPGANRTKNVADLVSGLPARCDEPGRAPGGGGRPRRLLAVEADRLGHDSVRPDVVGPGHGCAGEDRGVVCGAAGEARGEHERGPGADEGNFPGEAAGRVARDGAEPARIREGGERLRRAAEARRRVRGRARRARRRAGRRGARAALATGNGLGRKTPRRASDCDPTKAKKPPTAFSGARIQFREEEVRSGRVWGACSRARWARTAVIRHRSIRVSLGYCAVSFRASAFISASSAGGADSEVRQRGMAALLAARTIAGRSGRWWRA